MGMSFIKSASHNYAGSDYVLQPDDWQRTAAVERSTAENPDPNTLQQRLNNEVWPTRGKVKVFTKNPTFVELRFTKNDSFQHVCRKATEVPGKHHCALCYHRQSKFGCFTCKGSCAGQTLGIETAASTFGTQRGTLWQRGNLLLHTTTNPTQIRHPQRET
jgi:hypothetical protein